MGSLILPPGSVAYADTSVFIYTIESYPDYAPLLTPFWEQLERAEIRVLTSELTLLEALVSPLRARDTILVDAYEEALLRQKVELVPTTPAIYRRAAQLRAAHNLRTPDAIHASAALSASCTHFITNDPAFRRVPGFHCEVLDAILPRP